MIIDPPLAMMIPASASWQERLAPFGDAVS
jgi:hypothetical protein